MYDAVVSISLFVFQFFFLLSDELSLPIVVCQYLCGRKTLPEWFLVQIGMEFAIAKQLEGKNIDN
jgi:hypothetical protein